MVQNDLRINFNMLKQILKFVFYLIISLLIAITVTLITDSIENIAVEKKIRKSLKEHIKKAIISFKASAPQHSDPNNETAFIKKYVDIVMENSIVVNERKLDDLAGNKSKGLLFLFTITNKGRALYFYIQKSYLDSELAILDTPAYISGILTLIIVFTFIIFYTENKKRAHLLKQEFEAKQEELNMALKQNEALALLGRMSAALAHELKTPVSTISNLSQTLPSRHTDEQFVKRFVTMINDELNRMQQLIDNLLAYGKDIEIRSEEWIPLELLLRNAAFGSTVAIKLDAQKGSMIYGDRFYLELLFKNLIRNSCEAGADEIQLHISYKNNFVEIAWEDNGAGFPDSANLDELTKPFITSRSRGGGLGLYLGKKIVTAHNGSLSLYRPGKGAGIKLILPMKRIKIYV